MTVSPSRLHRVAASAALALLVFPGSPFAAEQQERLGSFRDWSAFSFVESGAKVCAMMSQPKKSEQGNRSRGDIFAFVTHRPGQKSTHVVSFIAGYSFRKDSEALVTIGSQTFRLFTEKDGAWARDDATDRALIKAMRTGTSMVVAGTSERGTQTKDTFSLFGSGAALDAIDRACNVNR